MSDNPKPGPRFTIRALRAAELHTRVVAHLKSWTRHSHVEIYATPNMTGGNVIEACEIVNELKAFHHDSWLRVLCQLAKTAGLNVTSTPLGPDRYKTKITLCQG